jgi:hypothetical protein
MIKSEIVKKYSTIWPYIRYRYDADTTQYKQVRIKKQSLYNFKLNTYDMINNC